jgi:alkylation response protein AidB-like acyl-CoA dehydrogenase
MISHFTLEDRHREQRERAREFCEAEIDPIVERHEKEGTFPTELIDKAGEADLIGVPYPEEYGGAGQDYRSFAITIEELAHSWKLFAGTISAAATLVSYPVYEFGAEWQREEWVDRILSGEWYAGLSMTEDEAGSDAAQIETTAERDGDEYVINGKKVWTTSGEIADFLLVVVRTEPGNSAGGISLVGIPNPDEVEGLTFERNIPSMEGEAAVETEIRYDDVRVPAENLVGEEGAGFRYVMEGLDIGRIGTAAQGVGVGQAAFEASDEFASEREQFGQRIKDFQGVSFKIADMATEVEAARLLTLHAASERDRGERVTKEAAMAKMYATDVAMDAATEAVQIHGARGYSKDYPVERYMRVAKGMQIYEGTNEINRIVINNRLDGE